MKKQTALSLLALFALAFNASADTLAQWNFNSPSPDTNVGTGTNAPSTGTGTASLVGGVTATFATGTTTDSGAAAGDNSGWNTTAYAAQGTGNKTAGVQFSLSTLGFESIVISWEHRNSATASKYLRLQYSTDGVNFLDGPVITQTALANNFSPQSASLASIGAVDNNPNFAFRLVTEFESTATGAGAAAYATVGTSAYAGNGTIRFDLITITGSPATGNNPPTISSIANQTIRVDQNLNDLPFTVGDVETPAGDLVASATSSNPLVIPVENILFGGAGADRTVSLAPAFFATGSSTVTVTITDAGGKSAATSFLVTVLPDNTAPTIANTFTNYHTLQGVALAAIPFTIGDLETPADGLDVSFASSNPGVIPPENIVPGGSGANRTLTITPVAGQAGNAVITITVDDLQLTASRSFNVMVVPSAGVVLNEPFDYADGPATTNSAGLWANHSGIFGQLQLAGGALQMLSSQSEDISARLIGSPYSTSSGTILYASFTVNFSALPVETGDYFAHLREVGGAQRCRIFVSTTNSPAGTYRLGIANNNANITNAVTLPGDLATGADQFVVVRYVVATGVSTLWVNPTSESSPSVTATDAPTASAIATFAFRQNNNIGSPRVDNLRVGLALSDVATLAPAVRLTIARDGANVRISWPATATDEGYSLQSAGSLTPPINWVPVGINPDRAAALDSVTVPATGDRFYQLVK